MTTVVFAVCAPLAVLAGAVVFTTDSMLRAAYFLLASFVAVAVLFLTLASEFLFVIAVLMMVGEMTIMAVFMVMFMMNPAGLNPMDMTHQKRPALAASLAVFALLTATILLADFPARSERLPEQGVTAAIGGFMMEEAMLVFETVGLALLATMVGAIALARHRGRFGKAAEADPAYEQAGHEH